MSSSTNNQGGGVANAQLNNQAQGNLFLSLIQSMTQNMTDQEIIGMVRNISINPNANNNSKKKQENKNNSNQNKNNKKEDDDGPVPGFGSKSIRAGNNSTISDPIVSNDKNSIISNQLTNYSIDWNDNKNLCCQIPISGKLVTPKAYKQFKHDMEYFLRINSCPTRPWCDKFGVECTEDNFKKIGFNTSNLTTGWKKELGWKVHSSPNFAYENKFGIKPYYGPQWDKEGKMMEKWFDGRPKENNGASNGVSNVGVGIRGIPIYPDGGAVMGFGFGGSSIASGPMMYVGY